MKLYHKKPCAECPWRKIAAPGWLGGHSAEFYADAVNEGEIPACHLRDHGPDSDETAFCAGATSVMANSCQQPWKQEGAAEAVREIGKNDACFWHPALFYQHHTGEKYVSRFMRLINVEDA